MNEMRFTVEISAPKQRVWDVLWQDQSFREWANILDPGTYMVGELAEGNEVEFRSAENGYGVTSLVKKVVPGEYLLLLHSADTQDSGEHLRDKQWTGGREVYELKESDGTTTLSALFDVPTELETYFEDAYPKAFQRIKELAEA